MKKLLRILGTITIAGSGMTGIVANSPYQKQEKLNSDINYQQTNNLEINNQKLSTNDYLELNNKIIKKVDILPKFEEMNNKSILNDYFIKDNDFYFLNKSNNISEKIKGIESEINSWKKVILNDKKNNVYFGTNDGLYTLKSGETTAIKLNITNGINIDFGIIDNNDNIYIGTDGENSSLSEALYIIKNNVLIKINGIEQTLGAYPIESYYRNKIAIDSKNNVYIVGYSNFIYIIKSGTTTATKIQNIDVNSGVSSVVIDSQDNAYFRTNNALYVLKHKENIMNKIIQTEDNFNYFLSIDNGDNVYFKLHNEMFVLTSKKIKTFEISEVLDNIDTNTINNDIIIKNNNLYFKTYKGEAYVLKNNETTPIKINSNSKEVVSLDVDNSENIYLLFPDNERYSPFILRKNTNIPIKINGVTGHISHIFADNNNNIYIGSGNGLYALKSGETTATKIKITNSQISSLVFDKNNDVYFATDYDGAFVLKSGETTATKIEGINKNYGSYVEVYKDKKYDVIYFKTGGALYKLNGGENKVFKIIEGESPDLFASDNNNNNYYAGDKNLYVLRKDTTIPQKINEINGDIISVATDNKNNVYIGTNNGAYVLKQGEIIATKINEINTSVNTIIINNNDIVYFGTNNGSYVLKQEKIKPIKVEGLNNYSIDFIITDDYNVYFISSNKKKLFLSKKILFLNSSIKVADLEKINNNDNETILNNLNYLNHESNYFLNLNKMKIINKTPTSATIVATKGKYRGEVTVNYKIKNKDEINNIDLNNLLKKAVYFDFIDKNFYSFAKIKEIKDINIDNLNFRNVEITRNEDSKLLHSVNFKEASCFKKRDRINTSSIKKTFKIPKCDYNSKSKLVFQITTGLTKTKQENELNGWNINPDDEMQLHDFLNLNNKQSEIINVLSNEFDLSNINKQEQEMILYSFSDVEDEIDLAPHERVIFHYSVREINLETTLNLKQKITGTITAKIINDNNEEQTIVLPIKEAMQILQKYSLLPDEITINEDNSVTFNGKAKISLTQEGEPKLIINTSIV